MYQTTLLIDGMHCGMCESHVNDLIRRNFNPMKVTSSHNKGKSVILTESPLDEKVVRDMFEPTGYIIVGFSCDEVVKKGLFWKKKQ